MDGLVTKCWGMPTGATKSGSQNGCGLAAHVPIQCMVSALRARGGSATPPIPAASNRHRKRHLRNVGSGEEICERAETASIIPVLGVYSLVGVVSSQKGQ
jgi:hypothetical protein